MTDKKAPTVTSKMSIYETRYREPDAKYCNDGDTFLTVTLNPSIFNLNMREQHRKTFQKLVKFLNDFFKSYFLVVELTKDANIHYHIHGDLFQNIVKTSDGTNEDITLIHFKDVYKSLLKHGFGFHKIETVKNKLLTAQYLRKELSKTNLSINRRNKAYLPIWHYKAMTNTEFNLEAAHKNARSGEGFIAKRLDNGTIPDLVILRNIAVKAHDIKTHFTDPNLELFDDPFAIFNRKKKHPIPDTDTTEIN